MDISSSLETTLEEINGSVWEAGGGGETDREEEEEQETDSEKPYLIFLEVEVCALRNVLRAEGCEQGRSVRGVLGL